ncbi:MAG TPA: LPS export ABC transporter periplasmic protein LptC [Gammaproteobacteria bacterium]|nr:LPS export ABC transporter periplasmic protein LptC [Gammaproteobacteria bacterium]
MSLPNKSTLMSLLLIVALLFSTWLARNLLTSPDQQKSNKATTPDAFMIGMHYTQFDIQGQWKSNFDAERMVHYGAEDTEIFNKPFLVSRDENQQTWIINAKTGTAKNSGTTVYLKDNVQVQRLDNLKQKNLDLTTSALTAYPKRHFLETNQPVTIVQPGNITHAVGLTANMETGDINLLSNARGVYQPPPPEPAHKPDQPSARGTTTDANASSN